MLLIAILLMIVSMLGIFYGRRYQKRNICYLSLLGLGACVLYITAVFVLLGGM